MASGRSRRSNGDFSGQIDCALRCPRGEVCGQAKRRGERARRRNHARRAAVMKTKRFLVWYWSNPGGGRRVSFLLARRLAKAFGSERVTLSVRADDPYADLAAREGIPVLRAALVSDRKRPLATGLNLVRGAAILEDHVRASGADAVLLAMNFSLAAPLARFCTKPIVYFAHDPAPHPGDFTPTMQRLTQNALLSRARRVVALSSYAAGELAHITDPPKIVSIPLSAIFEPAASPRPALAEGPARLLFVGRLMRYKGLGLLADALGALSERRDWRLTVAGAGPEAAQATDLFKSFTQAAPVRAGWLDDEALLDLLREHDVLLAPYISATQSGTVAEALALGMPVIATPAGGLAEQVGAGGWVSASIDAKVYAETLARALADRAGYVEKSAAALNHARAAWSCDWGWLEAL